MSDLYSVLGVRKNASLKSITKAFRKKALESHPDRGGDRAEFEKVQLAFDVLSDPGKRKRYDETGEIPRRGADPAQSMMFQVIAGAFNNVVNHLIETGTRPRHHNLRDRVIEVVTMNRGTLLQRLAVQKKALGILQEALGRFKSEDGFMDDMVRNQEVFCRRTIAEVEEGIKANDQALDYLRNVTFEWDSEFTNGFNRSRMFVLQGMQR